MSSLLLPAGDSSLGAPFSASVDTSHGGNRQQYNPGGSAVERNDYSRAAGTSALTDIPGGLDDTCERLLRAVALRTCVRTSLSLSLPLSLPTRASSLTGLPMTLWHRTVTSEWWLRDQNPDVAGAARSSSLRPSARPDELPGRCHHEPSVTPVTHL